MEPWQEIEKEASASRCKLSNEALHKLVGGNPEHLPKIGVCLSGGGWRSMTSGVALFDALAVPVESKTNKDVKVKPLDCVSHAFGLSGGSWMLFNTLAGGEYNAYHRQYPNPWLYGEQHSFKESEHQYDGLIHMVSKEVVDEACHRGSFRKNVGFLSTRIGADATIAAALGSNQLGPSLVERWANFIGNDILGWIDDEEDVKEKRQKGLARMLSPNPATYKNTRNMESKSRQKSFGSVQEVIRSGALPYTVCAAIADMPEREEWIHKKEKKEEKDAAVAAAATSPSAKSPASPIKTHEQQEKDERHTEKIYDWVEFTPWFSRNPGTGAYFEHTDDLCGKFWNEDEPHPLKMHHLMAICGSAFACDLTCALPPSLTKQIKKNQIASVTNEPLIGKGTTTVLAADGSKKLGVCRDAGIDFNVPLPPMLEKGREFDIILIMDAGAGSKNAFELYRAVELGYIELMPTPDPLEPFGKGHYVRVFRGVNGGPIIIYMIGLCERGTHQIINHKPDLLDDVKRMRERVEKIIVPLLLANISIVQKTKERAALKGSGSAAGLLSASSQLSTSAAAAEEEDDYCLMERTLTETVIEEGTVESTEDDGEGAALDALGPSLGDEVRTMMLKAAASGKVKNMFDAYSIVEREVFGRELPDAQSRRLVLFKLEIMALKTFFSATGNSSPAPEAEEFIPPSVRNELVRLEILKYDTEATGALMLNQGWNDYFASTALAASLVRDQPDCISAIHRTGVMPSTSPNVIRNIPIARVTKMFTMLSDAIVTMQDQHMDSVGLRAMYANEINENIKKFLATPGTTMPQRQVALDNFVDAFTACQMDDQIMTFANTIDQRSQIQLACGAARCGNLSVLQKLPTNIVNKKNVLGSAYASTASEDIVHWLTSEHNVSLTISEACELGYPEATRELIRNPENHDSREACTNAILWHQEPCLAVLWAAASPKFKDVILAECDDHGVQWNPSIGVLTRLWKGEERKEVTTDKKARALGAFDALREKALTPQGMQMERNKRIKRNGVPLTAKEMHEEESKYHEQHIDLSKSAQEAKQKASTAIKGVMGFGKSLFGKKHQDPGAK